MIRALLLLSLLILATLPVQAQERVVLVVSANSPIEQLDSLELRKLYLGIDVVREGRLIRPLRNLSSSKVDEVFLQNVVGLTRTRYDRRLLANLMRFGAPRPAEYSDLSQLMQAVRVNPHAVTYLMVDESTDLSGLRVLRALW